MQGSFTGLVALTADQLAKLRADNPGVPEDYLKFLETAGYGMIGSLAIYSGLVDPTSVFGSDERQMDARYRAFADWNGDVVAAFDVVSWVIVEIREDRAVNVTDMTFSAFMNRWTSSADG